MVLSIGFLIGILLGGGIGFAVGFPLGMVSKFKGKRSARKESKAERLFNLAIQQENRKAKLEILSEILDKYPHSTWVDKALEEATKTRK